MKIFEIYTYSDPHKGYGYGEHKEYFLLDDPELEQEYDDEAPGNSHVGEQIATKAGYEGYHVTAQEVDPSELRDKRNDLMDRVREIDRVLGAADKKSESSEGVLFDEEVLEAAKRAEKSDGEDDTMKA